MANTIDQVYIETYERNVRHLAQQSITRLRPWVDERSVQSSAHNWERLAKGLAQKKSLRGPNTDGRNADTPIDDYEWSRRISMPDTWDTGDLTEQEDIVQMLVDPNSNLARAQGMAMRRAIDSDIIDAATADTALAGTGPEALPDAQKIGAPDAAVSMSYDLVTEVTEKFMDNDIDPDEEKVFVVGPAQARKLLQLTEATSGDYNAVRPLTSKGYIESWMGYTWIVSTLLPDSSGSGVDGDENFIFAMTKRALGLQMNKDVWVRIAEDPSKSFAWRVYAAATFGAVRVEDEHLVRINCLNTV